MLSECRVVVVQSTSSAGGRQVLNVEVKEQKQRQQQPQSSSSRSGRFSFTSAVDVNWRGSQQVKELQQHHQRPQERIYVQSDGKGAKEVDANRLGKEQLNVHHGGGGGESSISSTNPFRQELLRDENDSSLDLETMHLMLEPNMRPVTPDPSSRISLEIFNEHKQLAQEFLKVQTEIAYVTQHRDELLSKMDVETRRQKLDYCSKLEERDALLKLETNLRKQLELINQSKAAAQVQFPVQQNRLQNSSVNARNDDTLTNQQQQNHRATTTATTPSDNSSVSSVESPETWVFLDPAKL